MKDLHRVPDMAQEKGRLFESVQLSAEELNGLSSLRKRRYRKRRVTTFMIDSQRVRDSE